MEFGIRILGFLQAVLRWLFTPLYFLWSLREVELLPPMKSPFLTMSATELAAKIRSGQIRSEDVIRAFIMRIKEVNPVLNAVVEDRFPKALEEAREIDRLVASKRKTVEELQEEVPLLGVPITIKESCKVSGLSYCVGHLPRKGMKAEKDGKAVSLLRKAGAIPLLVSATPELCLSWESNNLVTGRTTCPFDPKKTSGGSSGGEGALLGSGSSIIGVGSDIGGSIRIPGMYNGIFGHKPTAGIVSIEGHMPNSLDSDFCKSLVIGPMARYAVDLKPMLKIMAGDSASSLKLNEKVDLHKIKVFYKEEIGFSFAALHVDWEIKDRLRQAVKYLQKTLSVPVERCNIKEMDDSIEISCSILFGMDGLPSLLQEIFAPKVLSNLLGEVVKSVIGTSQYSLQALLFAWLASTKGFVPSNRKSYYYNQMKLLQEKLEGSLGHNGVFLYPTHPTAAVYHGQSLTMTAGVLYTVIFNVMGMPSTHVPLGLNKEGMPIGIQVIAAPNNDRLCLAVAEELERGFGGWIPPPMATP